MKLETRTLIALNATLAVVMIVMGVSIPNAFAVTDIECKVRSIAEGEAAEEVLLEKILVPDITPKERGDWTIVGLGKDKILAITCLSASEQVLDCSFVPGKRDSAGKDVFDNASSFRIGGLGLLSGSVPSLSVDCSSLTLWTAFLEWVRAPQPRSAPIAKRALSQDEMNFCQGFHKRAESFGGDFRLACISLLKLISRPLTRDELYFCSMQDRDAEGFGIDRRLECVQELVSGT